MIREFVHHLSDSMKYVISLVVVLPLGTVIAAPPAVNDSPEHIRAKELVAQLGSSKYKEREKAATELIKMGRAAKTALVDGKASHADPEVQTRCQQLLPQALALDLMFRIERFLKDTDGKLEHDLPLWKNYRAAIGSDESARQLFAEMLRANGALLESAEEEPGRLAERVQQRTQEIYQEMFGNGLRGGYRPSMASAGEVCCLMLVMALPAYKPTQPDWMFSQLFTQPTFTTVLGDEKKGASHRKMFFHYLDVRMDENTMHQCAWMFCQHRMKEGADIIIKALKDGKASQAYTKATALCCVGTIGGKEHLKTLEPYLKDDTMVQQAIIGGAQRGAIKLCDVALAMTIHLSGKNPKDYGFVSWQVYARNMIQYHQLGFATDEDRAAAFKKWNEDAKKADVKK
jgi:hypothetical protein